MQTDNGLEETVALARHQVTCPVASGLESTITAWPASTTDMVYIIVRLQNTDRGLRNLEPEGPKLWSTSEERALLRA